MFDTVYSPAMIFIVQQLIYRLTYIYFTTLITDEAEHFSEELSLLCLTESLALGSAKFNFGGCTGGGVPSLADHIEKMERLEEEAEFGKVTPISLLDEFCPSQLLKKGEWARSISKEEVKIVREQKRAAADLMAAFYNFTKSMGRQPPCRKRRKRRKKSKLNHHACIIKNTIVFCKYTLHFFNYELLLEKKRPVWR